MVSFVGEKTKFGQQNKLVQQNGFMSYNQKNVLGKFIFPSEDLFSVLVLLTTHADRLGVCCMKYFFLNK